MLDLVKTLQEFGIQPINWIFGHIVNFLDDNQNAGDVADLLINLGNQVESNNIQSDIWSNLGRYLPGVDDTLKKIADNQTTENILKLAKVLIALGKNISVYDKKFKIKISNYNANSAGNQDLEELLKLNLNKDKFKYAQKQKEFIKYFTTVKEESEEKKEDKKSKEEIISNNSINNKDEEGIILLEKITDANYSPLKINDESGNFNQFEQNKSKYKSKSTKFVKDFTEVKKEAERSGELIQNVSLIRGQVVNSTGYNYNNGNINNKNKKNKIEIKTTNGASNKNLKILGVALAILGILCIILSLTIAQSVLLSLLIPGCILFTAGISILVGLFCKHKSDKSINLSFSCNPSDLIIENQKNDEIDQSINLDSVHIKEK